MPLRLAIAERRAAAPSFNVHFKDLEQRFEEARLRGNQVHRREEARFELALRDAPQPALSQPSDPTAGTDEFAD